MRRGHTNGGKSTTVVWINILGTGSTAFSDAQGTFYLSLLLSQGHKTQKLTASCKLYLPTYWNNVIQHATAESVEYDYASNILPLPCDQGYNPQDMDAVADRLYAAIKDLERKNETSAD